MSVYYNECDPFAAGWLRALIADGLIPDGPVDERSILDVSPADLAGFRQCHLFAGIGGWAYALALAGWPDDRPVWTGSCPCQPFSQEGRGEGTADERHLWPFWFHLIEQCTPPVVFGEQVASKAAIEQWLKPLVAADLEGLGYAFGSKDLPAASVGAPHIRQRLFWVADSVRIRHESLQRESNPGLVDGADDKRSWDGSELSGTTGRLADADSWQCERVTGGEGRLGDGAQIGRIEGHGCAAGGSSLSGLADADSGGSPAWGEATKATQHGGSAVADGGNSWSGPVHGGWGAADWIGCRDGRWRPVEPGTFPLAHGVPNCVGRLRGYGNAIVPQVAAQFVEACLGR